jgi:hypothetical protein
MTMQMIVNGKKTTKAVSRQLVSEIESKLRSGLYSFDEIAAAVGCSRGDVARVSFRKLEEEAERALKFY